MPLSATDKMLIERIDSDFTYHPPAKEQAARFVKIREAAKDLAVLLVELCPDRRERSLAITKLEEAVMWGNAAIARDELMSNSGSHSPATEER